MRHYEVAAGVILSKDKVLITSRPQGDSYAGLWEFPGGKLEDGETLEECLIREIKEELGIKIALQRYLFCVDYTYPEFRIRLHIFLCKYLGGKISPLPGVNYKWVSLQELANFHFLEADKIALEKLRQVLI